MMRRRTVVTLFVLAFTVLTGSVFAAEDPTGSYAVVGQNPDGTSYTATATITKAMHTYDVQWFFDGQLGAIGVGILSGKTFAVIFKPSQGPIGLALYEIKGRTLKGTWTAPGSDIISGETLTKTGAATRPAPPTSKPQRPHGPQV